MRDGQQGAGLEVYLISRMIHYYYYCNSQLSEKYEYGLTFKNACPRQQSNADYLP